jgi:glucose-6-phosphate 1-dehydrogenase
MPSITVEPCTFALFGALGDLALRKLFPALSTRWAGLLHEDTRILALAREAGSEQQHLAHIEKAAQVRRQGAGRSVAQRFLARLTYLHVDFQKAEDYVPWLKRPASPNG